MIITNWFPMCADVYVFDMRKEESPIAIGTYKSEDLIIKKTLKIRPSIEITHNLSCIEYVL